MADTLLANAQEAVDEWESVAEDLAAALAALRRRRRDDSANEAFEQTGNRRRVPRDYYLRAPHIPPWAINRGGQPTYSPPAGEGDD